MKETSNRWSLDRRIPPLALVGALFAVLGAGGGAAMSTGRVAERVDTLEQRAGEAARDHDLLVGMRTDLTALKSAIERIEKRQYEERRL